MGERHLEQDHQSVDAAANDKNIIVLFFQLFKFSQKCAPECNGQKAVLCFKCFLRVLINSIIIRF